MASSEPGDDLLECGACGNIGIGTGTVTCCDQPMRPLGSPDSPLGEPTMAEVLGTVFDMSESELDVCLCVMEGGEQTVRELAERTDYDRSSVARHLGHLVDLGVLEKRRQLLPQGGHVYVYLPNDPETVRQSFRDAFATWVAGAHERLAELSREKVESIVETDAERPQWRIYKRDP